MATASVAGVGANEPRVPSLAVAGLYRAGGNMKILIVLTSNDRLGRTGEKTGFWLEELAAPYYEFRDAGAVITLSSPAGGEPPLDPRSDRPEAQTEATRRFRQDPGALSRLAHTVKLADVS